MFRKFSYFAIIVLLVVSINPPGSFAAFQPPQPPEPASIFRLNSEGDELIAMSAIHAEPGLPALATPPVRMTQEEALAPILLPASLQSADVELGIALDRARQDGPEAVLAFVASQPDPGLPLLQAALLDAQHDRGTGSRLAPAAPNVPRVSLNSGPCTFETIQAAVAASVSGDTIRVASGIYNQTIDISGKAITIEGGYDADCTTLNNPPDLTQILANVAGSVVDVSGGSVVTLRNLDLTGGSSFGAGLDILGNSRVTLENTDLHDNNGASGGGMYIGGTSVVTYTNDSDIYGNTASAGGGAIVYGRLAGFDTNSDIYQNSSTTSGGGIYSAGGIIQLDNADVVANTATNLGGGIYLASGAVITLTNSVFIGETAPCCQSALSGGGIYADASRIYLTGIDNAIMNNTATENGGGVYLANGSRLVAAGGSLGYDSTLGAGNDAILGAGLYADTSSIDFSGRIINNIASNSGGGLYATNSTITMTHATLGGLDPKQHNQIGANGLNGAGMYLINNTRAWLDNTTIISNTLSNPATGYAGGIYVRAGSAITLTQSSIEQHSLPSAFDGRGAAIYMYDATVTLSGTQVISNTTANLGGAVRMFGSSTLNILAGSSFTNNTALGGDGGAIAATGTPVIDIQNAAFRFNSASANGGGVISSGAVTVANSLFASNTAGGSGGGMYLGATGSTITNTTFSSNSANLGGGLFNNGGPANSILNATFWNNSAITSGGSLGESIQVKNTILAVGTPQNCNAELVSLGSNLDSGNSCGLVSTGDLHDTDPLLRPQQDNGGNTLTHALPPFSPAIDHADTPNCPASDQRGETRPLDGDGDGLALCDIGAFEAKDYVNLTGISISGPAVGGVLTGYSFTADTSPITATTPITYHWEATGQAPVTQTGGLADSIDYNWDLPGQQTITVTASSGMGSVIDTHTITLDIPITGLVAQNDSPTELGSSTTLTATLGGGTNVIYTWIFGDSSPNQIGQVVNHTYATSGVYTATVVASNAAGNVLADTQVTVTSTSGSLYLPLIIKQ